MALSLIVLASASLPLPRGSETSAPPFNAQFFLSLISVVRQESAAIVEWVEHHLVEGVEFIWVVDDTSDDRTVTALAPFTQTAYYAAGLPGCGGPERLASCYGQRVEVLDAGGNRSNNTSSYVSRGFQEAVLRAERNTQWLALIDTDEFLWGTRVGETASQALAAVVNRAAELTDDPSQTVGQVMVSWRKMTGYHPRQPSCMVGAFLNRQQDRYLSRRGATSVDPRVSQARGWNASTFAGVRSAVGKPIALAAAVDWLPELHDRPLSKAYSTTAMQVHCHPWKRKYWASPRSIATSRIYRTVEADGGIRRSSNLLVTPYDDADHDTGFRLAISHFVVRSYEWYHSVKACRGHVNNPLGKNDGFKSIQPPSGQVINEWLEHHLVGTVPDGRLAKKRAMLATSPDAWKYSHCKTWDGTTVDIDRPCAVISRSALDDVKTSAQYRT